MQQLEVLIRNDVRLILRNRLLLVLMAVVLGVAIGARFALPALDVTLAREGLMTGEGGELRFADTYSLWVVFIGFWQSALMPGTVFGFLLLDEKEDETLLAMRVSPISMKTYLRYRVGLPWLIAFFYCILTPQIIGLELLSFPWMIWFAACGAMVAPVTMMALATFAANKVQGLALTKFTGIAGLLIIGSFFTPGAWQWLFSVFPPFLICNAYWLALLPGSMVVMPLALSLLGVVFLLVILAVLMNRFEQKIR